MNPQRSKVYPTPMLKLKDSEVENMWDDFEIGFDRSKYAEYFDDFFNFDAGDWTITTTEAGGGDATEAITDAANGILLITNDAGAADLDNLQKVGEAFLPAAGKKLWFEARFAIGDVDSSSVLVGLAVTDTSLVASAPANGIWFQSLGNSDLDFVTSNTSSQSIDSALIANTDDAFVKVGFKVVGTSLVEYWVNDVKKGSFTTNIPVTEMRVSLAITNGTTAAETMSVDYVRVVQER